MLFRFLLVDPPWKHNSRRATRKDNPSQRTRQGIGAGGHYRLMSTPEICALAPLVQAVATPDAYLAMWVLESMPLDPPKVLEAWGFEHVSTLFSWVKINADGSPFFGIGKYSASNLERMILARRAPRWKHNCWHSTEKGCYKPAQVILAPKGEHSSKPEIAQDRIDKWVDPYLDGHGKLEMFARRHRRGWVCLGDAITAPEIADDLWDLANGYERPFLEQAGLLVPA